MTEQFLQAFAQYNVLQPGAHFIAAVSGGIDSVVLCELCHLNKIPFSIAHCNFGLRDEESNRDEAFVRQLATKYGVPFYVQHFKTLLYAGENGLSVQEAARELRYHWFETLRKEVGAAYILLAHHANDSIETMTMHFFRGTGLHGLTGIPPFTPQSKCFRPMLRFSRKEIKNFAEEKGLQWVEDSSNSSDKYTRNFFRNTLLPAVKEVYPQAEENLLHNIERFTKTEKLYTQLVARLKNKVLHKKGTEVRVAVKRLLQYADTAFIYEVLKDYGFTEKTVPELIKLADSPSGKYIENEAYRIIRHRAWFIISPKLLQQTDTIILEKDTKEAFLPAGVLTLEIIDKKHFSLKKKNEIAQLDVKEIQFPMVLRRWKAGDYFYPLGLRKKKKLSRFFIDQKLSLTEKEAIWVLESRNRICWVIGYRIDDRFKVTDSTQQVVQLTLSSH